MAAIATAEITELEFTLDLNKSTRFTYLKYTGTGEITSEKITDAYEYNKYKHGISHDSIILDLSGYEGQLNPHMFPENVIKIIFGDSFNKPIEKDVLPVELKILHLGNSFNQSIDSDVLPLNLHTLQFGDGFNKEINQRVLPVELQILKLGNGFNQDIKPNVLPNKLWKLELGDSFNKEIKQRVLPAKLQILKLGNGFNQDIKPNVLSSQSWYLKLGDSFNQKIKPDVLPTKLTELHLGNSFNTPIERDVLPAYLQKLYLGNSFNQQLEPNVLPAGLLELKLGDGFEQPIRVGVLPANLDTLIININYFYFDDLTNNILPHLINYERRLRLKFTVPDYSEAILNLVFIKLYRLYLKYLLRLQPGNYPSKYYLFIFKEFYDTYLYENQKTPDEIGMIINNPTDKYISQFLTATKENARDRLYSISPRRDMLLLRAQNRGKTSREKYATLERHGVAAATEGYISKQKYYQKYIKYKKKYLDLLSKSN